MLDATNDWALFVEDESRARRRARRRARARRAPRRPPKAGAGCKLTLRMPSYLPVMQYATQSRAARDAAPRLLDARFGVRARARNGTTRRSSGAFSRCASEEARLLGYANYAEVSLVPKMAQSAAEVIDFLRELNRQGAAVRAIATSRELAGFARTHARHRGRSQPHDLAFASERLKEHRYAFSDQEVRQYFPEHRVLGGLFRVAETLYGITIRKASAATWHPDVRFFEIRDAAGLRIGEFYLDLYARPGKQGGAWMDAAIDRRSIGGARPAPRRLPDLQPLGAGAGAPRDVHARRGHDDLPRVRARAAPAADARRRRRRVRHPWRRVGRGRAAEPVHGELLLGMGRALADDRARRHRRSRCRARCSTGWSPRRISRAAS